MERNIKLLAAFNFFLDFKFHSAILVLYFAKVTGSYSLAMSIYAVEMVSSAIFEVPTGILSDRIGRKQTVIIGSLFSVTSAILYALGFGYWWLFFGAVCDGISRAFYSGNNDALLHDSLSLLGKKSHYSHYLGKISSMFQAALTIGVVIGSVVAYFSFAWVMWLSVIPLVICFIISLFLIEPTIAKTRSSNIFAHLTSSFWKIWRNKGLRLLAFSSIVKHGVGEASFQFKSAFIATLWPIWAIGFAKMMSFAGAGVSFWFAGRLIRRFSAINLMLFETSINRISNTIGLVFPTVASPIIMASTSFLYGATEVSLSSLMQKEFSDEERATMASITSLAGSLSFSVFAILIGIIADKTSTIIALLLAQVFALPNILILLRYKKEYSYEHPRNRNILR